jgi:putative ABC transport system permease protein
VYSLILYAQKILPKLPLHGRFAVQALLREPKKTISQLLAFSVTLIAMILSFAVSHDLINDWRQQLPKNAPNHFALNIFPDQLNCFKRDLTEENIQFNHLYPIVKGRLVKINNRPVQQLVSKDSTAERAIQRDLSLTFSSTLPDDNEIMTGEWWNTDNPQQNQVSIEQKLAKSLQVALGDQLTFTVGSQQFQAKISSIRQVKWETMKPNFYMIFSPGTLENYPQTYLTSFYLAEHQKNSLNSLVKNYSAVMLLDVDAVLTQFKTLLSQLTQAINYLLYFALLAGFTVLFAAVYASLDQRIYEGALMRTLGANRRLLQSNHLFEFALLGFISGLLAIMIAEGLIFLLYHFVLQLNFHLHGLLWGLSPLVGLVTVAFSGYLGVQKVVHSSPMAVLRKTEN